MGFWIWMIIVSLIAGIIFGPLARLVLPGKQNISLGWTILGGGIGAFLGGLIAYFLGVEDTSARTGSVLIQIICAAIVVAFISSRNSRRQPPEPRPAGTTQTAAAPPGRRPSAV